MDTNNGTTVDILYENVTLTAVHCLETRIGWKRFQTIGGILLSFGSIVKHATQASLLELDRSHYVHPISNILKVKTCLRYNFYKVLLLSKLFRSQYEHL